MSQRGSRRQPTLADTAVLNEMYNQIKHLRNMDECNQFYDDERRFQKVLEQLREPQEHFVRNRISSLDEYEARDEWSRLWATDLSRDTARAWFLNYCRKTALALLYKVCNLALALHNNNEEAACAHIEEYFEQDRLEQILTLCLPMERANCLYNMKNTYNNKVGLGWYSKAQWLEQNPPFPFENPAGPSMNKRLVMLQKFFFAGNESYEHWLEQAFPPPLPRRPQPPPSRGIPIVSDDESSSDGEDDRLNVIFHWRPRNLSLVDASILDDMRNQINALLTVKECNDYYDGIFFQELLRRLRQPQQEFIQRHPDMTHFQARNEWSRLWALELFDDTAQSYIVKYCCRIALALLYKVCDLTLVRSNNNEEQEELEEAACEHIKETFQERRLDQILTHCLPMERARYLYHELRCIVPNKRGLGWYSAEQAEDRNPPFPFENRKGPSIDNRLVMIQKYIFSDDQNYEHWLYKAFPVE